jgi:hypothetical protein
MFSQNLKSLNLTEHRMQGREYKDIVVQKLRVPRKVQSLYVVLFERKYVSTYIRYDIRCYFF